MLHVVSYCSNELNLADDWASTFSQLHLLLKTTLLGINKTTLLGITHFKAQNDYAKNLGRGMAPWLAYVYKYWKSTKLKSYFDLNVYFVRILMRFKHVQIMHKVCNPLKTLLILS